MKTGSLFWSLPVAMALFALSGCSQTVRYLTPMTWLNPPAAPGMTAVAPGATAAPAESRTLYVTYWEGSCLPKFIPFFGGCSLGDSKIRRCNVKADNQLECVDEVEASKAFARQK
jgi:hypothetical protein